MKFHVHDFDPASEGCNLPGAASIWLPGRDPQGSGDRLSDRLTNKLLDRAMHY
jgi:hypothetical protein